jgi:hypothetical protein
MVTAIKIKKTYSSHFEAVMVYYNMLNVLNSLNLTPSEIKLMTFTAINKVLSPKKKKEYCREFLYSEQSLSGVVCSLKRRGILIKNEHGRLALHPQLHIEFDSLALKIVIENG